MNLTIRGRTWRFISAAPHIKKNGSTVKLHTYETDCAKCGAPFQIVVSENCLSAEASKNFGLVHCKAHRLTPGETCARGRQAVKDYWADVRSGKRERPQLPYAKVTPALRAEIKALAVQGFTAADLVLVFPLCEATIRKVIKGKG